MKRSQINRIIFESINFLDKMNFKLPPFFYWTLADWADKGTEYDEIRDCKLGWDVTDFGLGDFASTGLVAMTIRNGILNSSEYPKPYAEKCLVVRERQVTPMHFHFFKMEDIINRGGHELCIACYNASGQERLAATPVKLMVDGRRCEAEAGTVLRLKPGESITLPPRQYHTFWAEGGTTLVGEVSRTNDDNNDNRFLTAPARFSEIEEDEAVRYPLIGDIPRR